MKDIFFNPELEKTPRALEQRQKVVAGACVTLDVVIRRTYGEKFFNPSSTKDESFDSLAIQAKPAPEVNNNPAIVAAGLAVEGAAQNADEARLLVQQALGEIGYGD